MATFPTLGPFLRQARVNGKRIAHHLANRASNGRQQRANTLTGLHDLGELSLEIAGFDGRGQTGFQRRLLKGVEGAAGSLEQASDVSAAAAEALAERRACHLRVKKRLVACDLSERAQAGHVPAVSLDPARGRHCHAVHSRPILAGIELGKYRAVAGARRAIAQHMTDSGEVADGRDRVA